MSLTVGTSPFGERPAGRFNTDIDPDGALLFWDPVPYRVRATLGKQTVLDSRRVKMLCESALPPRYYFPAADVRIDLLVPSSTRSRCAYKGSASYWHLVNERVDLELDGEPQECPRTQYSRD